MGVFLSITQHDPSAASLPHARGGVSGSIYTDVSSFSSSPRPWGCFSCVHGHRDGGELFPTPVGVFPALPRFVTDSPPLPHARGGVSAYFELWGLDASSSPRPWGCFQNESQQNQLAGLFPTPVGVFPIALILGVSSVSLPHARGGVSAQKAVRVRVARSSPRPWGCFSLSVGISVYATVFPTPVGVFLLYGGAAGGGKGLPHARGGVSVCCCSFPLAQPSSPRPWGCFSGADVVVPGGVLFPTPVGVFPHSKIIFFHFFCLPHARGGVSKGYVHSQGSQRSSPHTWGCFRRVDDNHNHGRVFPTLVGGGL